MDHETGGHVAHMGVRNSYKFLVGNLKGRDHWGDLVINGRIILKWTLNKYFTACILQRILLGWLNYGGWGGRDMWNAWGRGEVFIGFWLGSPNVRDQWEDLGVGGRIKLKWTLWEIGIDGANWIRLAQVRVQWRAFVGTVMNLQVP